jgi:hypothetical protein
VVLRALKILWGGGELETLLAVARSISQVGSHVCYTAHMTQYSAFREEIEDVGNSRCSEFLISLADTTLTEMSKYCHVFE